MAEPDLIDPVVEARARAQLALANSAWNSLKITGVACVTFTGVVTATCSLLVTVKTLEGWHVKWLVLAALVGSMIVSYCALEAHRVYERALALADLFRTIRQYETLLKTEYAKVVTLEDQIRALSTENSFLRTLGLQVRVPPQDDAQAKE